MMVVTAEGMSMSKSRKRRAVFVVALVIAVLAVFALTASAAINAPDGALGGTTSPQQGGGPGTVDPNLPNINIDINGDSSDAVRILLLLTILTILPSILIMTTSFTRIIVTFSLLRNAIGLQQTPPNQVLIGLALFLSMFIMSPVIQQINETAYQPFSEGEISAQEFIDRAEEPLKDFMLTETRLEDLNLFIELSEAEIEEDPHNYPITTIVPAFIVSELKAAFTYGFFLFIPFLVIDMVVSSALMSMGMMMLPPITISLPFKLMLFVLVDGWGLLIRALVQTF
jgi:flagellar biosynthetic protein FliP